MKKMMAIMLAALFTSGMAFAQQPKKKPLPRDTGKTNNSIPRDTVRKDTIKRDSVRMIRPK